MAILKDNKIIRRCNKCQITNDLVDFRKQKCSKNGKMYTHNLCMPCYDDRRSYLRKKHYKKNREEQIAVARKWNIDNRERYNERRRIGRSLFNKCIYE